MKELVVQVGPTCLHPYPVVIGKKNLENLDHNAGITVYINLPGLCELVMHSRVPFVT